MKNFTNNFKQFTSRLSARWLIMALMMLVGTSSAWAWSYKAANDSWNCRGGNSNWLTSQTYYTSPTGSTTKTIDVVMLENPGSGFNILQQDHCNNDNNDCLYVGLTSSASSSTSTIVRGTAYWNNALYSTYTVVIPEGKIYIKPTNGTAIEMQLSKTYSNSNLTTKRLETCTYTAELSLSSAKTFDLYAADPGATITAEWGMPDAGKPSSVRLNYTNLVSDYQYVKVTYNLITNQITFEEMTPPCDPPAAPDFGSVSSAEYCYGDVVSFPTINGVTLKWYDEETGGNVVESPETNVGSTNYYAAAVEECESTDRTAYTITINPVPSKPSFTTSSEVTCSGVTVSPTLSPALAQGNYLVWYDAATGGNKIGTDGKTLTSGANNTATTYYAAVSNGSCESATRTPYTVYVESTDITNLRLYLVDDQGNELPDDHVYCQGETVKFKLSYNGGKYTYYSWNQTVQANNNISGSTSLNEENNTGAGSFTLAGVQSSGTIAITLKSCSGQSITSNALQVTVAPVPTISIKIRDLNVSTLEVMCHELVTLYATTENTVDGALVYWYKDGVQITENGQPVTGDSYTFTSTIATTFSNISAKVQNGTSCPAVESNKVNVTFEAHAECPPSYKQGKILYFNPKSNDADWSAESPIYKATFNNNKGTYVLIYNSTGYNYSYELVYVGSDQNTCEE